MNFGLKIIISLFLLISWTQGHAQYLPKAWFLPPEIYHSGPSSLPSPIESYWRERSEKEELDKLSLSFSNILSTHDPILEKLDDSQTSSQEKKWKLLNLETNLAISTSGLLGILSFRGQSNIKLIWRRPPPPANHSQSSKEEPDLTSDQGLDIVSLNEVMTAEQIHQQVEPALQAALASGDIKKTHEEKVRRQLHSFAEKYVVLIQSVLDTPAHRSWYVNRLRFDLTVSSSGMVLPFADVGGQLRFRFEWARLQKSKPSPSGATKARESLANGPRNSRLFGQMQSFVQSLILDLESLEQLELKDPAFPLSTIFFGFGLEAQGNIHMARAGAGVLGLIYFARRESPAPAPTPKEGGELLMKVPEEYLLASPYEEKQIEFAKKNKIEFSTPDSGEEGEPSATSPSPRKKRVFYKLKRENFRKGLQKGLRMANFFLEKVKKHPNKKWQVFRVETEYDVFITGGLGLASLTGSATVRLFFDRKDKQR